MEDGWAWIFRSSRESGWWSGGGGVSICNGTIPLPQAGELALETHGCPNTGQVGHLDLTWNDALVLERTTIQI